MSNFKAILKTLKDGTFQTARHPDTLEKDLKEMYEIGYVDDEYNITTEGIKFLEEN